MDWAASRAVESFAWGGVEWESGRLRDSGAGVSRFVDGKV